MSNVFFVCASPVMLANLSTQCFLCSRNTGSVTRKIIYFHYLEIILDQSIQKAFYFILKTEALVPGLTEDVCIFFPVLLF